MPTARYARIALSVAALTATACNDATGPDGRLPGRRLLDVREFSQWTWVPSGTEVVFSTPFDAPYTGPPTRLDAITVSGGSRRTVVAAPSNGDRIIGYRFVVVGSHVYYEVLHPSSDGISFYRAPLDGRSPPEKIIEVSPYNVSVSPDEHNVAWVERGSLVTTDIATGARRAYPLQHEADRVNWSPSGRSVVVDPENLLVTAGTPLQWVDLGTGSVRVWFEPRSSFDTWPSRDIGWDGESPMVYVAGVDVARYSMATGARELLSALPMPGHAIGWSPDFETAIIESAECLKWSGGIFGSDCIRWINHVDRIAWRSGVQTRVLRYDGAGQIFGRAAPAGSWLAYEYRRCGGGCPGDGLYGERIP